MENGCLSSVTKYMLCAYLLLMIPHYWCVPQQEKARCFDTNRGFSAVITLESS